MLPSRYTIVGWLTRYGARLFARHHLPLWSPKRWLILWLAAVVPVKVLGFLTWRGAAWYLDPKVRAATHPGPLLAAAIVGVLIGILLGRDRLPAPVSQRLPG
ncbi:MAG: hypothetical protein JHC84_19710 [Solirubrobacteraceae bacterium]|nr:hypothetical protein [Solirubrobacteraceae bacterium]